MICNACGISISNTWKFCNNCGAANSSNASSNKTDWSNDDSYRNEFFNQGTISRVEALFTDPPVAPPPAPSPQSNKATIVCSMHASATAAAACVGCGSFFCRNCLVISGGRNFCHKCHAAQTRAAQQQQRHTQPLYAPTQYPPAALPQPYLYAPPTQAAQHYPQAAPPYLYAPPAYPFARPPMLPYKRKEPAIALLLSFFMPGLGQIYNGDVGKGVLFLIGFWILVWVFIGWIFWVWAMIDAHQSATDINFGRRA